MSGILSGNGTILADQLGYRGGAGGVVSIQGQDQGERFGGIGAGYSVPNLGGGGAGAALQLVVTVAEAVDTGRLVKAGMLKAVIPAATSS